MAETALIAPSRSSGPVCVWGGCFASLRTPLSSFQIRKLDVFCAAPGLAQRGTRGHPGCLGLHPHPGVEGRGPRGSGEVPDGLGRLEARDPGCETRAHRLPGDLLASAARGAGRGEAGCSARGQRTHVFFSQLKLGFQGFREQPLTPTQRRVVLFQPGFRPQPPACKGPTWEGGIIKTLSAGGAGVTKNEGEM